MIRATIVFAGVALIVMKAWIWRDGILLGDIVQYLDMGDYFLSGQFDRAISACWSPLYPILLALFLKASGVSLQAAIGGMRVFNCIVVVGCFLSFLFLFRTIRFFVFTRFRKHQKLRRQLPSSAWFTTSGIAVATFVFSCLNTPAIDTPDLLFTLILCWTFNALLLCVTKPTMRNAAVLGLTLGLSYLCNAIAFVLLPLFVLLLRLETGRRRLCAVAVCGFLAAALPWIVAISLKHGSLTVSTSWFPTYIQSALAITPVNSSTYYKTLRHPPDVICAWPRVVDFGAADGSYPQAWDLNRWVQGMPLPIMPDVILVMLVSNTWFYLRTFVILSFVAMILPFKQRTIFPSLPAIRSTLAITLIPVVMLVLYALTVNMYIYGFCVRLVLLPILLLMLTALLLPRVKEVTPVSWTSNGPCIAMTSMVSLILVWQIVSASALVGRSSSNRSNAVANQLIGLGIKPGALFAYTTADNQLWTREIAGRATIAIFMPKSVFDLKDKERRRLFERLRVDHIEAIVYTTQEPHYVTMSPLEEDGKIIEFVTRQEVPKLPKEARPEPPKAHGWQQVPGHPVYILLLNEDFDLI